MRFPYCSKKDIICPLIISLLLISLSLKAQDIAPRPYGALPNANQLAWQENNLYAFIHFGINTYTDKEWGYGDEDPKLFNPKNFDADQIVRTIKQGGFKGIILTCKHHDGFCLWPTKTTTHNISKSPFRGGKGDLVREIENACRKYGLKFGVYLSPWDRNSKEYGTEQYIKMYRDQLTELLTQYGKIFEIWHDGANGGDGYYGGAKERRNIDRTTYYNWPSIWKLERNLQPAALIFGDIGPDLRWVGNEKGFAGDPCWQTFTPQSNIPGKQPSNGTIISELSTNGTRDGKFWMPAEVDFSIRPGWFWHQKENNQVKTAKSLWDHYLVSVGRGASMLLNIPPDQDGLIFSTDSMELKKFGDILRATFKTNLAKGATITASNTRANDFKRYGTKNLLDDNQFSYWSTDNNITTATLDITLPKVRKFDIIQLKENTKLGQRIDSLTVEAFLDGNWRVIGTATSIGSNRLIRLEDIVSTNKLRIRILQSSASIALSDFALYAQPVNLLKSPDPIPQSTKVNKTNWQIENNALAKSMIDNNENSTWKSISNQFPQEIILNLGKIENISAFYYLPGRNEKRGYIDKYALFVSHDNLHWEPIAKGEFANIAANPIWQRISFASSKKIQFIKFQILHTTDNTAPCIAELSIEKS